MLDCQYSIACKCLELRLQNLCCDSGLMHLPLSYFYILEYIVAEALESAVEFQGVLADMLLCCW